MTRETKRPTPTPFPEKEGGELGASLLLSRTGGSCAVAMKKDAATPSTPFPLREGILGVRFFLLLLLLTAPACTPKPGTSGQSDVPKAVPVTVADAKQVSLQRTVTVTGTLYPYEDVTLAPKVGGKVLRTLKDLGDRVGPGELLLELDATEYRLAVEQARPAFEAELRKLKLKELPATDATFEAHIPNVDAVAEARANLKFAESELKREEGLAGVAGTAQALDTAVNRVAVAKARLQLAETDARVTLANARRLKAMLEDAERKFADTKLYAPSPPEWNEWLKQLGPTNTPLSYAVAQKMVSAGSPVESMPATSCFRLVIDHALKLGASIPEKHSPEVVVGQPVEVRVQAHSNQVFKGVVARISPTIDTVTRTFGVVIGIRNGDAKLKAGGFATAEIVIRSDTVTTIPPEALVQFAGVNKVFVVEGDKAKVIEVTIGTRDNDWVEVGGLPPGAKVITSGQSQLVDGSLIRVK